MKASQVALLSLCMHKPVCMHTKQCMQIYMAKLRSKVLLVDTYGVIQPVRLTLIQLLM